MRPLLVALLLCVGRAEATTYSTDFSANEDPISEGGHWVNGAVVGLDWGNAASAGGFVQARLNNGGGPSYNDSTALLTGTWGSDQEASAVVYRGAGVVEGDYPEVELRLRSSLAAHSCTGYEVMFSLRSDSSCYVAIVRWNGAFGNFTVLNQVTGTSYVLSDGAQLKATIVGSKITAYIGTQMVVTATDTTYTGGTPGVGFDHNGPSSDDSKFGFTSFAATDNVAMVSTDMAGAPSVDMAVAPLSDLAVADLAGGPLVDLATSDHVGADLAGAAAPAGCGCVVAGSASPRGAVLVLLALGFVIARARRRAR